MKFFFKKPCRFVEIFDFFYNSVSHNNVVKKNNFFRFFKTFFIQQLNRKFFRQSNS